MEQRYYVARADINPIKISPQKNRSQKKKKSANVECGSKIRKLAHRKICPKNTKNVNTFCGDEKHTCNNTQACSTVHSSQLGILLSVILP